MSSLPLIEIRRNALSLNDQDKAQLASELIASLDGPSDSQAAEAWDQEIVRRIDALDSGDAELKEIDQAITGIREKLTQLNSKAK